MVNVITLRFLWEVMISTLVTGAAFLKYQRNPACLLALRGAISRIGMYTAMASAAGVTLVIRLSILHWQPPPVAYVQDEFSNLLVADTLINGRLSNPPHPLRSHLETIYVLQQPRYASAYPIGQGIPLVAGQLITDSPWVGVLVVCALLAGAVTWMLFAWLPAGWAVLGGILIGSHYALLPDWINSYWGGSFCALGGALFFGALGRLRRSASKANGFLLGLGWSITWLIRPFESLVLGCLTFVVMTGWLCVQRPARASKWLRPLCLAALVVGCAGVLTAAHNASVTGSPLMLPYQLSRHFYGVPQSFRWQSPIPEPSGLTAEQGQMYCWQRERWSRPIYPNAKKTIALIRDQYFPPWYLPPILFVLLVGWKDRELAVVAAMTIVAVAVTLGYPFFFPHYIAAYTCVFGWLILRGLILISRYSVRGYPFGYFMVMFLLFGGVLHTLRIVPVDAIVSQRRPQPAWERERIRQLLMGISGTHVVFVRYSKNHNVENEWVYNAANIDRSPIVWVRTLGRAEDTKVLEYYPNRRGWTVEVDDTEPARLSPLNMSP